jgi:hypothetical protein
VSNYSPSFALASPSRLAREVALVFFVSVGLAFFALRAGRLLTFDGYHYVEFAKRFAHEWPDRFGNHWPFGWPLAGGMLARLGVPAYHALLGLSSVSLLTLLATATFVLRAHSARLAVVCAVGLAPIVAPQLIGVLTELPLAAALLALALCLAHWPRRAALWGAAGCAVLALGIRYAGLVALAMIAVRLAELWTTLRAAARLREALAAAFSAALVSALLLGLNILKSGHASGAERGNPPGLAALPLELSSYGWSAPSALIAGGLRDLVGPATPLGILIGGACFIAIAALCAWSWWRPLTAYSRSLALVAFGYSAGMGVLHCIGDFDALYNARTFLPALAPLALLAAERLTARRTWLLGLCSLVVVAGAVGSLRGVSREIGGDVTPAVTLLRPLLTPADRIAINDHAFALAAYFPNVTTRTWPEYWDESFFPPFIVVAGKPRDREGRDAVVQSDWLALAERLVATGRYRYLIRQTDLIALQLIAHPAASP